MSRDEFLLRFNTWWLGPRAERVRDWGGPCAILVTLAIMLWWSWLTWPDALVDFGRELYVPWQVTRGKVLHRDVNTFYGPLSPHLNALWFMLFGVGLRSLVLGNLLIMGALMYWLYQLAKGLAGRLTATVVGLVFVTLFACAQYITTGNYNYVCPYSHEAVHGLTLSVGALFCLMRHQQHQRPVYLAVSGLLLGLVFLTKPEPFLAAALAVGVGAVLALLFTVPAGQRIRNGTLFALGVFTGPLGALGLMSAVMPVGDALRGVLGSWPYLGNADLTSSIYFQRVMGFDDVKTSIREILAGAGLYTAVMVPTLVAARKLPPRTGTVVAVLAFPLVYLLMVLFWPRSSPNVFFRPLTLFMVTLTIMMTALLVRDVRAGKPPRHAMLVLPPALFTLVLLAKLGLAVRISHYGFVLAMPATMMLVMALVAWIPQWIQRSGGHAFLVRAVVLGFLAGVVTLHLQRMGSFVDAKTFVLGEGADQFKTTAVPGQALASLLKRVAATDPRRTMVTLPEGPMVNYLARIPYPIKYVGFLPSDFTMYGEEHLLHALSTHPPDLIAVTSRSTAEYGPQLFGRDYAKSVLAWMQQHYGLMERIDEPGTPGSTFVILLLGNRLTLHAGGQP